MKNITCNAFLQKFAKDLLDVADNLGRASSVVKESFAKVDTSKDTAGVVPILKTLLEGVEMTQKQLDEVRSVFGLYRSSLRWSSGYICCFCVNLWADDLTFWHDGFQVFKRNGIVKFDAINEPFDPHMHNAVFQVPDASKPPGTVARVLKVLVQ